MAGSSNAAATVHAPFALLPINYPQGRFQQAKAAMPLFNTLVHNVSRDEQYLADTLALAAEYDAFTAKLVQLMHATSAARAARRPSEIALGIHRSDYMLDLPSSRFLQVGSLPESCLLAAWPPPRPAPPCAAAY